jgi:hypothetical protein
VDGQQAAGGQLAGQSVQPFVDVVSGQPLEPGCPDHRYQVLASQDPVAVDGACAEVLGALGEPVVHGLRDRAVLAGLDAGLNVLDGPDELVSEGRLGLGFALDPLAVPPSIEAEADRAGETVAFRVDRRLVLAD